MHSWNTFFLCEEWINPGYIISPYSEFENLCFVIVDQWVCKLWFLFMSHQSDGTYQSFFTEFTLIRKVLPAMDFPIHGKCNGSGIHHCICKLQLFQLACVIVFPAIWSFCCIVIVNSFNSKIPSYKTHWVLVKVITIMSIS